MPTPPIPAAHAVWFVVQSEHETGWWGLSSTGMIVGRIVFCSLILKRKRKPGFERE
jgi:hypothetical protein